MGAAPSISSRTCVDLAGRDFTHKSGPSAHDSTNLIFRRVNSACGPGLLLQKSRAHEINPRKSCCVCESGLRRATILIEVAAVKITFGMTETNQAMERPRNGGQLRDRAASAIL